MAGRSGLTSSFAASKVPLCNSLVRRRQLASRPEVESNVHYCLSSPSCTAAASANGGRGKWRRGRGLRGETAAAARGNGRERERDSISQFSP